MNIRPSTKLTRRAQRKLRRQLSNQPQPRTDTLVTADDNAVLTHAERGDVQFTIRSCRTIENEYNSAVTQQLVSLNEQKPGIVVAKVTEWERTERHSKADSDLKDVDNEVKVRGQHLHRQRRMGRRVRIAILIVLSSLDILAYRGAVEVVFATSDDFAGRMESLLLAALAIGMILLAAASGERVRHWLDMKAEEETGLNDPTPIRSARRELMVGITFGCLTVAALWAGATLRVHSMEVDGNPISPSVSAAAMIFSALAALGAFVVELRWSSEILDKRDRLVSNERHARKQMERQQNRCAKLLGRYQACIAEVTTLWDRFSPLWHAQINACLERLHRARKIQPRIFHPLSSSVDGIVRPLVAEHQGGLDPVAEIERLRLRLADINEDVEQEIASRLVIRGGDQRAEQADAERADVSEARPPLPRPSNQPAARFVPPTYAPPNAGSGQQSPVSIVSLNGER